MKYKFVKGIIDTLGVKNVLKVEFAPGQKCNYDCLHCELGRANNAHNNFGKFTSSSEIFIEIQAFLVDDPEIKFVMLSGCGHYALYSGFSSLVKKIRENLPELGIMTYTNASILSREEIQEELAYCNIIGCNINSVFEDDLYLCSKPSSNHRLRIALEKLKIFSNHFTGMFIVETEFIHGINDTEKNIDGLINYLSEIQPNIYAVKGKNNQDNSLSEEFTLLLKNKMNDAPFPVKFHLK